MRGIYKPSGRALEYSSLAVNLYTGCEAGCLYCMIPAILRITREDFKYARPRKGILDQLRKDVKKYGQESPRINLCFTCDPYTPWEEHEKLTRKAIEIMGEAGLKMSVLTKNPGLAIRDFDLFRKYKVHLGVTLTYMDRAKQVFWEPGAPSPTKRMVALEVAHNNGITTWVSLEPIIDPRESMKIVEKCHKFVDYWKAGPLNYSKGTYEIDWSQCCEDMLRLFNILKASYYIKDDLWKFAPVDVASLFEKERTFPCESSAKGK